jgi:hypothetical protein
MRRYRFCSGFWIASALLTACTGSIGDGSNPGGGGGGGSNGMGPAGPGGPVGPPGPGPGAGGSGPGTSPPPPSACAGSMTEAAVLHARMLSPRQYDNTVQDLLAVGGNPSRDFGGGADTQLDDLGAERRANAAAAIARQAASQLATWSPCAATAPDCKQKFVDQIGMRAFRHPLSAVERQQLTALFDAGIKEKDFTTGVEWFLTGLLQTPDFLYQFARPAPGEQAGKLRTITGYEMASRLSYFLWDSLPDDKLFAAAAAPAALGTPASLQAEVTRMMQDPRFLRGVTSFYSHWLAVEHFGELARDDRAFTTDLVKALSTSLLMNATQLYSGPAPSITALFSGQSYFMNGALRAFYGKGAAAGAEFTAVDLPGENRHGILTHPALMAQIARPQKTHPINRGLFVRGKLLCQELHAPDGIDIPQLPDAPMTGVTTREEVAAHAKDPTCAACHVLLDPPGFALESFDQVGRHRKTENGRPVDTSGTMVSAGDLDGAFASGEQFVGRIGASATVRTCFAQQYFQFAIAGDVARPVAPADRCSVDRVGASFVASGDLKALVQQVATSDSFRYRTTEGGGS